MRRIAARTPPSEHARLRASGGTYEEMSGVAAVRQALYDEQGGICAYCEQLLSLPEAETGPGRKGRHKTKIEHFHPRHSKTSEDDACLRESGEAQLQHADTAWSNMLLCCHGGLDGANVESHCDTRKDGADICARFRNPKTTSVQRLATVEPDGRLVAASGMPHGAQDVIDGVLGLNNRGLVRGRHEFVRALRRRIAQKKQTHGPRWPTHRNGVADKLELEAQASRQEFPSVLLAAADRLRR